jgi:hypothetical protein
MSEPTRHLVLDQACRSTTPDSDVTSEMVPALTLSLPKYLGHHATMFTAISAAVISVMSHLFNQAHNVILYLGNGH